MTIKLLGVLNETVFRKQLTHNEYSNCVSKFLKRYGKEVDVYTVRKDSFYCAVKIR